MNKWGFVSHTPPKKNFPFLYEKQFSYMTPRKSEVLDENRKV